MTFIVNLCPICSLKGKLVLTLFAISHQTGETFPLSSPSNKRFCVSTWHTRVSTNVKPDTAIVTREGSPNIVGCWNVHVVVEGSGRSHGDRDIAPLLCDETSLVACGCKCNAKPASGILPGWLSHVALSIWGYSFIYMSGYMFVGSGILPGWLTPRCTFNLRVFIYLHV